MQLVFINKSRYRTVQIIKLKNEIRLEYFGTLNLFKIYKSQVLSRHLKILIF